MLDQLPEDWKWEKLGMVCQVVTGTTPPKSDSSNYGNDIPFFKPPHLWDEIINDTDEKLSLKGSGKARIVPPNTVLVTCIGNLGRTGLVKKTAAFNQQINAILENENIEGKYIFYQAQSPLFRKQLEKLATGTTVSIVNKSNFETIDIPLPPKSTQQAIVSKIEELFSELDKGIESLRLAQQQLKTYRQSLLKWAFEGKLTNENVKDGELPDGWKWVLINEIGKVKGGKRLPPKHQYSEEPTDFVYIMAGNLKEGTVKNKPTYLREETYNALVHYKVTGGEVYITIVGACIGDAGVIPEGIGSSILTENAAKIIELKDAYNKYLAKWINSTSCQASIKSKILSATLGKIALNRIGTLEVPLPTIEEQHKIIDAIESRLSVANKMEESINQSLQQAEALRQSILKKAFEGKLIK